MNSPDTFANDRLLMTTYIGQPMTHAQAVVWRPIETAPTDGTLIIVHRPGSKPNAYIPLVGEDWWSEKRGCWMGSNARNQPTDWMPMPAPPEPKS